MAEDKKSFLLYCDLIHTIEKLPDEKAGVLFKHILKYVNDKNPTIEDLVVELVFEPIKQQLKRDLEAWRLSKFDKSQNGILGNLKRWNPDLYSQVIENQITIEQAQEIAKHRKASQPDSPLSPPIANVAVNVTATVTDTANVNDTPTEETGKPEVFDFKKSLIGLGIEAQIIKDYLQVRKTKKLTNTKTAFDALVNEINKTDLTANEVIKICAAKSWGGFKKDWIEAEIKSTQVDIKTHAPVWVIGKDQIERTVLKDGTEIEANDYYGCEMLYIDKIVNWRKCR